MLDSTDIFVINRVLQQSIEQSREALETTLKEDPDNFLAPLARQWVEAMQTALDHLNQEG